MGLIDKDKDKLQSVIDDHQLNAQEEIYKNYEKYSNTSIGSLRFNTQEELLASIGEKNGRS
jgi:hypothetical protein